MKQKKLGKECSPLTSVHLIRYVHTLLQGIFKDNVTGGYIRLKGHGCGVTRGTLQPRLPTCDYSLCNIHT